MHQHNLTIRSRSHINFDNIKALGNRNTSCDQVFSVLESWHHDDKQPGVIHLLQLAMV